MLTHRTVLTAFLMPLLFCFSAAASSQDLLKTSTPETLYQWRDWVLFDKAERLCPTDYNNGDQYRCHWPSRLILELTGEGGAFEQIGSVFAAGWQSLPGDASMRIWRTAVQVDGQPAPVVRRDGRPFVRIEPGEHTLTGAFSWRQMPEMMHVPPDLGLIELTINGRRVDRPRYDPGGRLWLQPRKEEAGTEDRLQIHVYRLLTDAIPMRIRTSLRLEVSGRAREIELADVLPAQTEVLGLESPLPARLGPEGVLLVQARPGKWDIRILARSLGPVDRLASTGRYAPEIWSFQARNPLRMVEIDGVPSVEPAQTDMPQKWRNYPAFLMEAQAVMTFKEIRRGDPDPAPDRLTLLRTWWLDFDGGAFTLQDQMKGTMSRSWRVSMAPPYELGRVSVDGQDRLITRQGPSGAPGVELRRGNLNLVAEARYEAGASTGLPAVGWRTDFQHVSGVLNLPPGWRLFASSGVDRLDGSWIQGWTLLDFFVVLIIALAVYKLHSWRWALVALVTMALIFQEPGAPVYVWLHILAASALFNVLPDGKVRSLVKSWGVAAAVFLLAVSIPFMVQQMRWGLFPQLEPVHTHGFFFGAAATEPGIAELSEPMPADEEAFDAGSPKERGRAALLKPSSAVPSVIGPKATRTSAVEQFDPNALIQTGPGLPQWQWRSHRFEWNGPVHQEQNFRLWLIPPWGNLFLAVMRVLLLGVFIFGVINLKGGWERIRGKLQPRASAAGLGVFLLLSSALGGDDVRAADFPPPELLKQFEARLLEKPDCLPHCADILGMELTAKPSALQVLLNVHAASRTAVPLPVTPQSWIPEQVLIDQRSGATVKRDGQGRLWVLVPEGIHTVALTGRIAPGEETLQIPFALKPQQATYVAEGWQVIGIDPDGSVAGTVQLIAERPSTASGSDEKHTVIPPFLHVHRTLQLGLTWQVATRVTRVSPPGTPIVVFVPLLPGASVTTPGIDVREGAARIDLGPGNDRIEFASVLNRSPSLSLKAPEGVPWTETWTLDASPIWHCETRGIPVVHHQGKQGQWQPEWRPWPGETVEIAVTRPEAIAGRAVTLDAARLHFVPGRRSDRAQLRVTARTSKGGQHLITLAEGARLQVVKLNDKSLPVRLEGNVVSVPLRPGSQEILLEWNQPAKSRLRLKAPAVDIGEAAVNARVSFEMPPNLWILFTGGPRLGPAVRFWSYLFVMVLAALALARSGVTPLRYVSWLLLSVGLTQVSVYAALIVVGWFFVLAWRAKSLSNAGWFRFNLVQLLLVLWTVAVLVGLYNAVERGLLGTPDMQIAGNDSTRYLLNWTQDRIDGLLPRPWVLAVPMWVYRLLMLSWSLWLAFALLKWLRWGWSCYSSAGIWKKPSPIRLRKKAAPPAAEKT